MVGRDAHVKGRPVRGGSLWEGVSSQMVEAEDTTAGQRPTELWKEGDQGTLCGQCPWQAGAALWRCAWLTPLCREGCSQECPPLPPAACPSWEQEPHSVQMDGESQNRVLPGAGERGRPAGGQGLLHGLGVGEAMSRAPAPAHTTRQLCSLCVPQMACKILLQERVPLLKGSVRTPEMALCLSRLGKWPPRTQRLPLRATEEGEHMSLRRGSDSLPRAVLSPGVCGCEGDTATCQLCGEEARLLKGKAAGTARLHP